MLFGMDDLHIEKIKKLYQRIILLKVKNNFAMFKLDLSQETLSEFLFRPKNVETHCFPTVIYELVYLTS